MKYILYSTIGVFSLIQLTCSPGDSLEPPYQEQLIVHAFFVNSDSVFQVRAMKSLNPYVPQDTGTAGLVSEDDADRFEITLSLDAEPTGTFNYIPRDERDAGIYNYKNHLPEPVTTTQQLLLEAEHEQLGKVSALQKMPAETPLETVRYIGRLGVDITGNPLYGVELTLSDPPDIENFYQISIVERCKGSASCPPRALFITFQEPFLASNNGNSTAQYLNDSFFNGTRFSIIVLTNQEITSKYVVRWRTISPEWYAYAISISQGILQDLGSSFTLAYAEPFSVVSNINGGLGCFGVGTQRDYDIEF